MLLGRVEQGAGRRGVRHVGLHSERAPSPGPDLLDDRRCVARGDPGGPAECLDRPDRPPAGTCTAPRSRAARAPTRWRPRCHGWRRRRWRPRTRDRAWGKGWSVPAGPPGGAGRMWHPRADRRHDGRLHDRGDYTGQAAARARRGHTRAGRPQLSLWLCRPCLRVVHDRACRPWRREFDSKQSSLVPGELRSHV